MALWIGSRDIAAGVEVHDWYEHGLEFPLGQRGAAPRKGATVDLVVLHWTGGEGVAATCYRTLRNRGLGVHLFIDGSGEIFQFADLAHATSHAGIVNRRSVGIEIANVGTGANKPIRPRPRLIDEVHGRRIGFAAFTPEQTNAAVRLVRALCDGLDVPRRVPLDVATDRVLRREMRPEELVRFRGVVGHYHVTRKKVDPGPVLLENVRAGLAT